MRLWLLIVVLALAGCADMQIPPTPADLQAKRFEAVPDKSVIYVVRDAPDFSSQASTLWLGESVMITTYEGTYYRWEVAPGTHQITGYGPDNGRFTLTTEPGRVYFIQQRLQPFLRFPQSAFALVADPYGRAAVSRAVLVGQ
jgi:hypothetical protein